MKVSNAAEMRELDRLTIEEIGIPGLILMEHAGMGVAEVIEDRFPDLEGMEIVVACGKGNNGGDGYVVARNLWNRGANVSVYSLASFRELKGDVRTNARIWKNLGHSIYRLVNDKDLDAASEHFVRAHLIIDAIFGTGLSKPVKGFPAQVIEAINNSGVEVASVDIPSGLSADSSSPIGEHIRASFTVTFGLPKVGNLLYPARHSVGDLIIVDIGIPEALIQAAPISVEILAPEMLEGVLEQREPDAHKGHFGHALLVAGSPGLTGAAAMAGEAAAHAGAGLVTVACPQGCNAILEAKLTEVMTKPLPQGFDGTFSADAVKELQDFAGRSTAVAIGPGMGQSEGCRELVASLVRSLSQPLVIDADGLNNLVGHLEVFQARKGRKDVGGVVLTPHPGEIARLLDTTTAKVQEDRLAHARKLASETHTVVVLKGAQSLIAFPDGMVFVNPTGNPAMASGGMGDVLTGIIAGFLAQGIPAETAALLGTYLHGLSGDHAQEAANTPSLLASNVLSAFPATLSAFLGGDEPRHYHDHPHDEDM